MLLFSRLYNQSYFKFEQFLSNFLDGNESVKIGLQFEQQTKNVNSVPDGGIYQNSFKIAIETKLSKHFNAAQLQNHLNSFQDEDVKILWAISPEKMASDVSDNLVKSINEAGFGSVTFIESTFKEIVKSFKEVLNDTDVELNEIIDDFEEFCTSTGLIIDIEDKMMVIPCRLSMKENVKFNIYYCPDDRNYSAFSILGLYSEKAVRYIGKLKNKVKAELTTTGELKIISKTSQVTEEQRMAIMGIINESKEGRDWDLTMGHQFFLVEQFYETLFEKHSPGGQQKNKFFYLSEYDNIDIENQSIEQIANELLKAEWGSAK